MSDDKHAMHGRFENEIYMLMIFLFFMLSRFCHVDNITSRRPSIWVSVVNFLYKIVIEIMHNNFSLTYFYLLKHAK